MSDTETLERQVATLTHQLDQAESARDAAHEAIREAGVRARTLKGDVDRLTGDVTRMAGVLLKVVAEGGPHAAAAAAALEGTGHV